MFLQFFFSFAKSPLFFSFSLSLSLSPFLSLPPSPKKRNVSFSFPSPHYDLTGRGKISSPFYLITTNVYVIILKILPFFRKTPKSKIVFFHGILLVSKICYFGKPLSLSFSVLSHPSSLLSSHFFFSLSFSFARSLSLSFSLPHLSLIPVAKTRKDACNFLIYPR